MLVESRCDAWSRSRKAGESCCSLAIAFLFYLADAATVFNLTVPAVMFRVLFGIFGAFTVVIVILEMSLRFDDASRSSVAVLVARLFALLLATR